MPSVTKNNQDVTLTVGTDNSEKISRALSEQIKKALEAVGIQAETDVARITPVDTGRLRASITHQLSQDGRSVQIGTNVEYAPNVELGIGQRKQSYLVATMNAHGDEYRDHIKDELENAPEP